jgi:hypothetical protein
MRPAHITVLAATLLASVLPFIPLSATTDDALDPSRARREGDTLWYDLRAVGVEGQGWRDTKAPFDRLPARAEGVVRDAVWGLSRHSAGLCARFISDAPEIQARWTVTSTRLAMPHMAATGVSGLDLYVRGDDDRLHWLAVGQPREAGTTQTAVLAKGLPPGRREYLLYLPLYNGVSAIEVGVPDGHALAPGHPRPPDAARPIVFYGTSITQGACASRPGMCHVAILGRRLDRPVINLGFSGNGKMEMELADLLAGIEAAVYVLDCLPNMTADEVAERVVPFVLRLRKTRPDTPILLVEDRTYADSPWLQSRREQNVARRAALKAAYEQLRSQGVSGLTYLEGAGLLEDDEEATVDGSHPTDLGFVRMADAFARPLSAMLDAR